MKLTTFIWQFVRAQRWQFVTITLLSFVWVFDMTFWPYFLRLIVDTLTLYDADRQSAWPMLKILLICGAVLWILVEVSFRYRDFLWAKVFPRLEAEIRMTMFDHIQRHSPKYFNEHFSGSLANKIGDMISTTTLILRNVLTLFLPALTNCMIAIFIFAQINAFLAAIAGIWIAVHFTICAIFTPKCAKYSVV